MHKLMPSLSSVKPSPYGFLGRSAGLVNPDALNAFKQASKPSCSVLDEWQGESLRHAVSEGRPPSLSICETIQTSPKKDPLITPSETEKISISGYMKRRAEAFYNNVAGLVDNWGLERVGFLTITFADDVQDKQEAERRFNNLARRVLQDRYNGQWLKVFERQTSGRCHFHLLICCQDSIRDGFDFSAYTQSRKHKAGTIEHRTFTNRYGKSASPYLRGEWSAWRDIASRYNLGRCELIPIRKDAKSVARYLAGYLNKSERDPRDKGARLWSISKDCPRCATTRFSWVRGKSAVFRRKCETIERLSLDSENKPVSGNPLGGLFVWKQRYGKNWAREVFRSDVPAWSYPLENICKLCDTKFPMETEYGEAYLYKLGSAVYGQFHYPDSSFSNPRLIAYQDKTGQWVKVDL